MKSFPRIQSSAPPSQYEFTCFVEHHVAGRDALYQADDDAALPGDTVRMTVTTEPAMEDVVERRHTIEFISLGGDGHWQTVVYIGHAAKEIQAMQGQYRLAESTFEVGGPGIPDGEFRRATVESLVWEQFERLREARLLPLRSERPVRQLAALAQACAAA
jgi:hypothetical protein